MDSCDDFIHDVTTPASTSRATTSGAPPDEVGRGATTSESPPDPIGDTSSTGGARPDRTSWFQLGVVCFASFVAWTAFGAILPYLPLFLKDQAHSSLTMIGVIASMYYVGTLFFSSPLGWLSDSIGRKPVIVGGSALTAVAMLLFTTTTNPLWFILFRLLEGIGTAGIGPAGQAFIADITPERDRSKAYGILTTAQYGGLIIGPALAPPLYHLAGGGLDGFYAIFYFGAAFAAVTTVVMLAFVKEPAASRARRRARAARGLTERERPPYRSVLTRPILAFVVIAFLSHYAMGGWEVVWSIWLDHLGASKTYISMTWVAYSVPMLLAFAGGMLADRYNRFALMFVGYTISALSWIVYGVTTDLTLFLIVNVIEGFAIAFSYPAKQAFLIQVSPPRWLGTVTGIETTSMQLAGWLGSLTAPMLYARVSGYVLAIGGALALLGLAIGGPTLRGEWRRITEVGDRRSCEELDTLSGEVRPDAASHPPFGIE